MWIGCSIDAGDLLDGAAPTPKRLSTWCAVSLKSRPLLTTARSSSPFSVDRAVVVTDDTGCGARSKFVSELVYGSDDEDSAAKVGHAFELFPFGARYQHGTLLLAICALSCLGVNY